MSDPNCQLCWHEQRNIHEWYVRVFWSWIERTWRRCVEQSCNWWCLCCNKWFCWVFRIGLWVVSIVTWFVTMVVTTVVCAVHTAYCGACTLSAGRSARATRMRRRA